MPGGLRISCARPHGSSGRGLTESKDQLLIAPVRNVCVTRAPVHGYTNFASTNQKWPSKPAVHRIVGSSTARQTTLTVLTCPD